MYKQEHYCIDAVDLNVTIKCGARLFRLTSPQWCSYTQIADGNGAANGTGYGRFHSPQQRTTYCSNNVLVCISEVLFHMYRRVLRALREGMPPSYLRSIVHRRLCLVTFCVSELGELVALDSRDFVRMHGSQFGGTMAVHPDDLYNAFQSIGNLLREKRKRGIVYPSARHSRDHCLALFLDETSNVQANSLTVLPIVLRLIREDQDRSELALPANPDEVKLDATEGYYEFENQADYSSACNQEILNPGTIAYRGYVDFVRKLYSAYPRDAVVSVG